MASSYTLRGTSADLWKAAKAKAGSASQLVAVIEHLLKGWLQS